MLTRKMLSAMGIEAEKIDQIIEGHTETVNGLRDDLEKAKADTEKYKAEASKVKELEKKIEELEADAETAKDSSAKYEELKTEFEDYKAEVAKKEADAVKTEKFRELLKDIGLSDKGISMALKWQGVDGVELSEDGKIANAKDLRKSAKEDWAEYIVSEHEEGADTPTPPETGGKKMSKADIMAIKDRNERQKAISENLEVFGYKEL